MFLDAIGAIQKNYDYPGHFAWSFVWEHHQPSFYLSVVFVQLQLRKGRYSTISLTYNVCCCKDFTKRFKGFVETKNCVWLCTLTTHCHSRETKFPL
jgi:hypothetical protein